MTLEELMCELRVSRLDDSVPPYLWADTECGNFLNDAVRQTCLRQRALIESINTDVCVYPLAIGQRMVKLHPAILGVRTARIVDDVSTCEHYPLIGVTHKWLSRRHPHWETSDNTSARYWVPDYQDGYLAIDHPSDVTASLHLTVWRAPLDAELLDINDLSGEPVINVNWHLDLLDWAEYRAFSKKDAETLDTNRASNAAKVFEAKIGRLPSAIEIRLWGVSRLVGTNAEFL